MTIYLQSKDMHAGEVILCPHTNESSKQFWHTNRGHHDPTNNTIGHFCQFSFADHKHEIDVCKGVIEGNTSGPDSNT